MGFRRLFIRVQCRAFSILEHVRKTLTFLDVELYFSQFLNISLSFRISRRGTMTRM
jgi:hypothetical protein